MKRITTLLAMLQLLVFTSYAQTAQDDLKRMTAVYRTAKAYRMDITARFFSNDPKSSNPVYTGTAAKSGNRFFSEMMGRITLFNNNCRIYVDDNRKLIVYNKAADKNEVAVTQEEQLFMDSAFYAAANVKFVSQTELQKRIEVKSPGSGFERMELVLNAKTFVLEQVIYYYAAESGNGKNTYTRSEITYSGIEINAAVAESVFAEKKYISRTQKRIAGTGRYASYKVVDQTTVKYINE